MSISPSFFSRLISQLSKLPVPFVLSVPSFAISAVIFEVGPNAGPVDTVTRDAFLAQTTKSDQFGLLADPGNATGLTSLPVSTVVGGNTYSGTAFEGRFDAADGVFVDFATDFVTSGIAGLTFSVEDPASQDGGVTSGWGIDTSTTSGSGNAALLFDFTASVNPVHAFGGTLADVESLVGGALAYVVAYDAGGNIISQNPVLYPVGEDGDGEEHYFGISTMDPFGYLAIVVGDDTVGGTGHSERIALGDIEIGGAMPIPEPGRMALLLIGASFYVGRRRR